MSDCPTCGSNPPTPQATPESTLSYTPAATQVTGRDGVKRSIAQPLVNEADRGCGNWAVLLTVNGHVKTFDGFTPYETFAAASSFLKTNGIPFKDIDLWFNLNIQWVTKAIARRQVVRLEDLMAIATGNAPQARATRQRKQTPPMVWGRKGWGMLQMYLAQDIYEYGRFLLLATELSTWVNPDVNPSLGCADCFRHFSTALADLRNRPRYQQEEARRWLHALMNVVNGRKEARQIPFDEASTLNHWT